MADPNLEKRVDKDLDRNVDRSIDKSLEKDVDKSLDTDTNQQPDKKVDKRLSAFAEHYNPIQLESLRIYLDALGSKGRRGYHVSTIDKGPLKESDLLSSTFYTKTYG
jgi:hypothetical protein